MNGVTNCWVVFLDIPPLRYAIDFISATCTRSRADQKEILPAPCAHLRATRIMAAVMKIPLFPLDVVLFPGAALPLHIFEDRYKEMITGCLYQQAPFGVVRAQREGLAVIGCTAQIVSVLQRYDDGRLDIFCRGADRFEIELLDTSRSFLQAEVDLLQDDSRKSTRAERERCVALHFEVMELSGSNEDASGPERFSFNLDEPVSFQLAAALPADLNFKQLILALPSDAERTAKLLEFYDNVLPKLRRGVQTGKAAKRNGHIM